MGAKISEIQGVVTCSIINGRIAVEDPLGQIFYGNIDIDLDVPVNDDFFKNPVFMRVVVVNKELVLRRDFTFSVIDKDSRLLLDFGVFSMDKKDIFEKQYKTIGYMNHAGLVSPVLLDLDNKRLLHGRRGQTMSNGFDFILDTPFLQVTDLTRSLAEAHAYKGEDRKVFLYDSFRELDLGGGIHEVARRL